MLEGRGCRAGEGQKGVDFVLRILGSEKEHFERAQFSSFGFFCFTDGAIICVVGHCVALQKLAINFFGILKPFC